MTGLVIGATGARLASFSVVASTSPATGGPAERLIAYEAHRHVKRIVMFAMLVVAGRGVFASFAPASADSHKDNFRRECSSSRKCY
jgi:hypothetical protein